MAALENIVNVVPAPGWWVLYSSDRSGERRTWRVKVAAWGTFTGGPDLWNVVALVAGETDELIPARDRGASGVETLWHDGESWCTCQRYWHNPRDVDDYKWCEKCAGEIEDMGG